MIKGSWNVRRHISREELRAPHAELWRVHRPRWEHWVAERGWDPQTDASPRHWLKYRCRKQQPSRVNDKRTRQAPKSQSPKHPPAQAALYKLMRTFRGRHKARVCCIGTQIKLSGPIPPPVCLLSIHVFALLRRRILTHLGEGVEGDCFTNAASPFPTFVTATQKNPERILAPRNHRRWARGFPVFTIFISPQAIVRSDEWRQTNRKLILIARIINYAFASSIVPSEQVSNINWRHQNAKMHMRFIVECRISRTFPRTKYSMCNRSATTHTLKMESKSPTRVINCGSEHFQLINSKSNQEPQTLCLAAAKWW